LLSHYGSEAIASRSNNETVKNQFSDFDLAGYVGAEFSFVSRLESLLNESISKAYPTWSKRDQFAGQLRGQLYLIRNFIFNITASSERPMIPAFYERNVAAYKKILALAASKKIKVLPYIAPLRSDYPMPYIENQYKKFKKDLTDITLKSGYELYDFSNTVPNKHWGFKKSTKFGFEDYEVDFMHFTSKGHRVFAEHIYYQLNSLTLN
jgi:hypothetical protein